MENAQSDTDSVTQVVTVESALSDIQSVPAVTPLAKANLFEALQSKDEDDDVIAVDEDDKTVDALSGELVSV